MKYIYDAIEEKHKYRLSCFFVRKHQQDNPKPSESQTGEREHHLQRANSKTRGKEYISAMKHLYKYTVTDRMEPFKALTSRKNSNKTNEVLYRLLNNKTPIKLAGKRSLCREKT